MYDPTRPQETTTISDIRQSSSENPTKPRIRFSLTDRLRSSCHRLWQESLQAWQWYRGTFPETVTGTLPYLTAGQRRRVGELADRYRSRFENRLPSETAFLNYGYLDILDCVRNELNWMVPTGQHVCDLGSANFSYAPALHTFFRPTKLVGVEVDGHRMYGNGLTRIDYARGHIQDLPQTDYVVADYRNYHQSANLISAWFPLVTPKTFLAWGLPLNLFDPSAIFSRVANNLVFSGTFLMVNHSLVEAEMAHHLVEATGLVCRGRLVHENPLRPRPQPAVFTLWQHS